MGFAGSNIYWNGTQLTFDDVDVKTHERYQGVYFKWGSLVGISPMGAWNHDDPDDDYTIVYVPTGSNGNHVQSDANSLFGLEGWDGIKVDVTDFTNNSAVNRIDVGYATFLNADPANIAAFKGDICAYLSGRPGVPAGYWRMPTSSDFGATASYTRVGNVDEKNTPNDRSDDVFVWPYKSDKEDGTYPISNGYTYTYGGGKTTFFPASGRRQAPDGALYSLGLHGRAWSSSTNGASGRFLYFDASIFTPIYTGTRSFGLPVRCVKK
jgi:hypothetical protein